MSRKLLIASVLSWVGAIARAEIGEHPYPAVNYSYEHTQNPPHQVFVAQINLADKNVSIRVLPGGPDPDGPDGKWQTVLAPPTKVAQREALDVVINGDFFAVGKADAEGEAAQKVFVKGLAATVHGPAMTDGKLWATPAKPRASFVVHKGGAVSIEKIADPPADAMQIIAGSDIIVKDKQNIAPTGKGFPDTPHPRTAVGIADGGKRLVLLVADGRRDDAQGFSLKNLAELMLKLGCDDAINLDGGGSSMLGIRDPDTHKMQIMNRPSDGHERSVANVLGVSVTARK